MTAAILSPRPRRRASGGQGERVQGEGVPVGAKKLLPPQPPKAKPTTHLAAIHVLAGKCGLSDGDYRCLLRQLTGKESARLLSVPEREKVREHLQLLARRMGVGRTDQSARYKTAARPTERKIWALWHALGDAGKLRDHSPKALQHWVARQTGVSHLRFCSVAQQHRLIEALKGWLEREAA